jgi:diguanylate cyclase (GGDEF)-like protein
LPGLPGAVQAVIGSAAAPFNKESQWSLQKHCPQTRSTERILSMSNRNYNNRGEELMAISLKDALSNNTKILKSKASKPSMQAVAIAMTTAVGATLLASYTEFQSVTVDGIVHAQTSNMVLWVLDILPFVFGYIGQYTSYVLANEANMMVLEQTEELRQHANELEKQATFASTHDALTGLPNRALFFDRLEQTLLRYRDQRKGLAVLLLNIENLKEIQDTLGLSSTDMIVKQLATRLASWSGSVDSVARIDTHSFAIMLSEFGDVRADAAAHNLIRSIEPQFVVNTLKLTLQPSVGIVTFPEHGEDADTLLQRAGVAQYFASKSPSGYSVYSPSMDQNSPRRLTLVGEFKRALARKEMQLYFQPKVRLADNTVYGVEALARWNHAQHGFISPDEFIKLAENNRLIRPLSQWVLEHAFQTCAEWHRAGINLVVSVNLSAKDLLDPELPDQIAGYAAKTEIQPEWIMLEITESSIMGDPARALIIIERLRGMGYQFSIDDFGTGYSSMAYLKKLPLSELKIDKSFVMDMLVSENDAIIVRATIDLAHNLGFSVTAEGVESVEAAEILKRMGCEIGQGFLFSEPLTKGDLEKWLTSQTMSQAAASAPAQEQLATDIA